MAHDETIRRALRSSYIYDGLPVEAAAEKHGVSVSTAARWKRQAMEDGDDWDKARTVAGISGEGKEDIFRTIIQDYLLLHKSTIDSIRLDTQASSIAKAEAISRLADAFNKTVNCLGKVNPELSRLAVANDVLQHLSKFVVEKYPQHGEAFVEILEPFGAEIARIYG
jgi:transposase-like protein